MNSRKIEIRVTPNSNEDLIVEENPLKIYVKSSAEKNKANVEVLKLLAKKFNAKNVRIISGAKSRKKIVEVEF